MKGTILLVLVLALGLAAEVANADFVWGTPGNLGPTINGPDEIWGLCLSRDGLELYFSSNRLGGYGGYDLWVSKREGTRDEWGPPTNLGSPANSPYDECTPCPSSDGLTLYFSHGHLPYDNPKLLPGILGGDGNTWKLTRQTRDDPWSAAVNIGLGVNSEHAIGPSISVDGLSLYFQSHRPGTNGGCDLMVATRASASNPFANPAFLRTLNSSAADWCPDISPDGLVLFFISARGGGTAPYRLWLTARKSIFDPFPSPQMLPPHVNGGGSGPFSGSYDPSLSPDGSALYFMSDRSGGFGRFDIWMVPIDPVVDFNGDGTVDVKDVVIMTEHWGENYSLCDIGPTPLGDGIVDLQDLVVLTEYMELKDRTLIAHWALDEAESDIAYDSVAANDAVVIGEAIWRPRGGTIDGALQLDGIDDYVDTPFVLNAADGRFSVFAWIKGRAAGQAIISQTDSVNWLMTDSEGKLMTELRGPGRSATPLLSETTITDGEWHRIGFVWDGSNRTLYVDGIAVAQDMQNGLNSSSNGLYIGTGNAMAPGTYFSGLIDDVRIYNRAVKP